ncbi:hypothetical protein OROHE_002779 [Orobanche hederae]
MRNNTLKHEFRMFIRTWNVGGRSPGQILAADLDQWLNLNSAVDIYVLGRNKGSVSVSMSIEGTSFCFVEKRGDESRRNHQVSDICKRATLNQIPHGSFIPHPLDILGHKRIFWSSLPTRHGEKHRTPAWCDRIIWHVKGIQQLSYVCGESKFSDHRPVSAIFTIEIEILGSNPRAVASSKIHPCTNDCRENVEEEEGAEEGGRRAKLGELIKRES